MKTIILSYATLSLITLLVCIWWKRKHDGGLTLEETLLIIILSIIWPVAFGIGISAVIVKYMSHTIIPSYTYVQKIREEKKRQITGFDI